MGRRAELIIERRYADPSDPDYERDLEICAITLLKLLGIKDRREDLTTNFTSHLKLARMEIK